MLLRVRPTASLDGVFTVAVTAGLRQEDSYEKVWGTWSFGLAARQFISGSHALLSRGKVSGAEGTPCSTAWIS